LQVQTPVRTLGVAPQRSRASPDPVPLASGADVGSTPRESGSVHTDCARVTHHPRHRGPAKNSPDRAGEVAYFIDRDGARYRVNDVVYDPPLAEPHKRSILSLESPTANHRYLVTAGGIVRAYRFSKGEARQLDAGRLAQQLNGAGFAALRPPNAGARKAS
jgi:hypothetical protein